MENFEDYGFSTEIWFDSELDEWFFSVIQEFDGEPETLLYGSTPHKGIAADMVADFIVDLFTD